jgi:hypothetical protein
MGRVFPETQQLDLDKLLAEAAQHVRAARSRTNRPAHTLAHHHLHQQQQQQQGADQHQALAPPGAASGAGYQGTFPVAALAAYTALMDATKPPGALPPRQQHNHQQLLQCHGSGREGKMQKLQVNGCLV